MGICTNYLYSYRATDTNKGMKIKKIKNFDMNKNTYSLRRKVINLIYEVKNSGVSLPRIEVRIGEPRKKKSFRLCRS